MKTDELVKAFQQMTEIVSASNELHTCWSEILKVTGQTSNSYLSAVDIDSDLVSVIAQAKSTLDGEPPSPQIRVLWFGLFDGLRGNEEYAGYYIAGWASEEQLEQGGTPPYFPQSRCISSKLLDSVKTEGVRIGESPQTEEHFRVFDYALMFGAAATMSRFAGLGMGVTLPIYVGFDSGDYARIAN